jgi:hypothetical protein
VKHKTASPQSEEGVLKEAARAIGGAAGTVAALANSVLPSDHQTAKPAPPKKATGKLAASQKTRLPRKQKKMLARRKTA